MTRCLFLIGAVAFLTTTVAVAQDPPPTKAQPGQPAQPTAKATRPDLRANPFGQPNRAGFESAIARSSATRMAALEEEFELLEAQRDVRRAHIRAAEVGVKSAVVSAEQTETIVKKGVVSKEELDKAQLDVEAAKAQLDIRMAELKEIEVKIKYAKKRLDDAKAAGVRPARPATPVDPPPTRPRRDRGN